MDFGGVLGVLLDVIEGTGLTSSSKTIGNIQKKKFLSRFPQRESKKNHVPIFNQFPQHLSHPDRTPLPTMSIHGIIGGPTIAKSR